MRYFKNLYKYVLLAIGCTVLLLGLQCKTKGSDPNFKTLKIDLDFSGRRLSEVNDPLYKSWMVDQDSAIEKTFNNTTIAFSGKIRSGWYKAGVQAPHYARLVNDGLISDGPLTMTISGLEPGTHSLLTFHNTFDNPESTTFSDFAVYLNGDKVKTITPSNRVSSTIASAMAYFKFDVKADQEVVIKFEAEMDPGKTNNTVVLNGFELDGENLRNQARAPMPKNGDYHVVVDTNFTLQWEHPENMKEQYLYFGTDKSAVYKADKESEMFKGRPKENQWKVPDLYSGNTYYWRVDQVDQSGDLTKGEVWSFRPAQLAFPGAEGYGRFAIGGRGGKVVAVTNLNDSGPGSLRFAVEKEQGPRTIVFNVSGIIELKSRLVVSDRFVTIAGQTAPGKGIVISRAPVGLTGDDGIIRFLRVRIGAGRTYDGMGLTGANYSIIDHCSISWTIDEAFSSRGAHHITLQHTLISEALNVAGHSKYKDGKMHGYAATIGGDIGSFHHNLLAHNFGRNWSMGGGLNGNGYYTGKLDIRNNVVYNWGHRATDGGANQVNFVNNYYKPGAATTFFYALNAQHEGVGLGKQQYYFDGNVMGGIFDESNQEKGRKTTITNNEIVNYETFVDQPFFPSYVETQSAREAYKRVLSDVGANQPLDQHDKRIIQETLDSTFTYTGKLSKLGGMIDTEKDVGGLEDYPVTYRDDHWDTDHDGLPNWWEEAKGFNVESEKGDFSDSNADLDNDGYTELEDYLNWLAQPHFKINVGEELNIDAKDLFRGFTKEVTYNIEEGKASINQHKIQFKASEEGFYTFVIGVKDGHGDTMKRTVNVFVY